VSSLNPRQEAFVREFLVSGIAAEAYRKAGYSAKDADANAIRIMGNDRIARAIAEGRAKIAARAEAKFNLRLDDILATLAHQITADRNALVSYRIGACRYCHGIEHRHQWRTHREFADAMEAYMLKGEAYHANHTPPDDEGGYGYRFYRDPNPDCPECEGDGIGRVVIADTSKLPPDALILFEGIKETKDGIEVKMPDRMKALELLGKHLGLADKSRDESANALAEAIRQISARGSSMPISTATAAPMLVQRADGRIEDDDEGPEP
jgi:hypothetical protein